jgi:hypothetical protein
MPGSGTAAASGTGGSGANPCEPDPPLDPFEPPFNCALPFLPLMIYDKQIMIKIYHIRQQEGQKTSK